MAGLILGIILVLAMFQNMWSYRIIRTLGQTYLPLYQSVDGRMLSYLLAFAAGAFLIFASASDMRRQRCYRLFESVAAGREWVEIRELAKEGRCSSVRARKYAREMIRKKRFHSAVMDRQEGMVLFGTEMIEAYTKAWDRWQEKCRACRSFKVTLKGQERALMECRRAAALERYAEQIHDDKIRELLSKFSRQYCRELNSPGQIHEALARLDRAGDDCLYHVGRTARQYIEMEKLDDTAAETHAAHRFRDFLETMLQE